MLYFAYKFDLVAACKYGKLIYTNHYNKKNIFHDGITRDKTQLFDTL